MLGEVAQEERKEHLEAAAPIDTTPLTPVQTKEEQKTIEQMPE